MVLLWPNPETSHLGHVVMTAKPDTAPDTTRNTAPDTADVLAQRIAAVRRFNRFYTRRIGVLQEGLGLSAFSLTEARILYELSARGRTTARTLSEDLGIDAGYLSRLVRRFDEQGLVVRTPSNDDARQIILSLTPRGEAAFAKLDATTCAEIGAVLRELPHTDQARLTEAMATIERILSAEPSAPGAYSLRPHRPGDMGWIVHRQAVLYAQEYGWNQEYEALISRIVADFLDRFDPARERCWIAEQEGAIVGSVFVVAHPERDDVAKLRLLYVEPTARGLGLGKRLVEECTRFAREAGYGTLTLWTNSVLVSARRLYEAEGYRLVEESPHRNFGKELVSQTWELKL